MGMALRRVNGKKFRWNHYAVDKDWQKVIDIQEKLRLRSRQDVIDIAVEKLYNEIFENGKTKE